MANAKRERTSARLGVLKPTLEVADAGGLVAIKGHLGYATAEHVKDGFVCNIAHLVVVADDIAHLVADTSFVVLHQRVAGLVLGADIAVDACPAIVAGAGVAAAHGTVLAARKRAADCQDTRDD